MRQLFAGLAVLALALMAGCSAPATSPSSHGDQGGRASPAPPSSPSSAPGTVPAGQTPAAAPTPPTSRPPAAATPQPTTVPVQSGVCGSSGTTISVQGNLTLNGAPYVLQIQMADYHGPGTYSIPPERVSLQSSNPSPTQPLRPALSGTVTVSPGGQGGAVDATLGPAGQQPVPLSATWACS